MNAITRTLLVGMLVALAQKGYALTCERADNKATIDYVNIDTSIAVPSALPKDTVLWRSPTYDFSVRCYQERENTDLRTSISISVRTARAHWARTWRWAST